MWDLAIDLGTGDLIPSANKDFQGRSGPSVNHQRITIRLRVQARSWHLDPTGTLGSRVLDAVRLPNFRAAAEVQLAVEEALSPMHDIRLIDVQAQLQSDPRAVGVQINYTAQDDDELSDGTLDSATFLFS